MSKSQIKTRVDATHDKVVLLQEMQAMINTLKKYSARVQTHIDVMIASDLSSMEAEKKAIEEMEIKIKSNGK